MPPCRTYRPVAGPRDRLLLGRPDLWLLRPFLPVVRYPVGEPLEVGLMYDAVSAMNEYGYSSTVFLVSIQELPRLESPLLTQPRLTYDTLDELAGDGWLID